MARADSAVAALLQRLRPLADGYRPAWSWPLSNPPPHLWWQNRPPWL